MDLQDILKNANANDSSFRALYDLTIDRVFSYTVLRIRDKDKAKDICQEVYFALWRALPKFQYITDAHFYSFLFMVVRRRIIKSRIKEHHDASLDEIYDIPDVEERKEDYTFMFKQLGNLKEKERMVVELRYFKDLDYKQIASATGTTENNARVLHHRSISKLQKLLKVYE